MNTKEIEWMPVEPGMSFFPGMVVCDADNNSFVVGNIIAEDTGSESMYDAGCGCCSSEYSAHGNRSVKLIKYSWLIEGNNN